MILLVVIAVVLLVAVVALALRGDSGAGTATPQAAGTASVAPTVSRPAGAPTSSGGDATHPAATGIPGSSPVEGSEPIASISPGTSPAASGSPEPSASDGVSSAPEGKRLESAGGVVFARCEAGKARLTWWEPKPGYTVESVEPGPALTVVAVFKGDTSRYRMTVTCVAGTPTPVVLPL